MYIKYEYVADKVFLHLPDSLPWEIRFRYFNKTGERDDLCLYLSIGEQEILLCDPDIWCQGRPDLPYDAVAMLYEEMVDVIAQKVIEDPDLKVLDINAIEMQLLEEKYEKIWAEKGFIELDENGSW